MGERQPLAELSGRFFWCAAIERHRRRRPAGQPCELRSPLAGTDVGNVDSVLPAIDDFFETMRVHDLPAAVMK